MRIVKIIWSIIWNFFIKIPLILLWRVFCLPGAILISLNFFFPKEWGNDRNVARSGRHYRNIETMAPWYSIAFYIGMIILFS